MFWNTVVATALLGTDKQAFEIAQLPEVIQPLAEKIYAATPDREERFLKVAALAASYHKAGSKTPKISAPLRPSVPENLPLCSDRALELLKTTLRDNWKELFEIWLQGCVKEQQRIPEIMLPDVLDKGAEVVSWADLLRKSGGKRAEWIAQFNPSWQYLLPVEPEQVWQTGTLMERKQALRALRHAEPAGARSLLQSTFKEEKADNRAEMLGFLEVNLSGDDLEFIREVYRTDKSQKARQEAVRLLRMLPQPAEDLEFFWNTASSWLKNEKGILTASLPEKPDAALEKIGITAKGEPAFGFTHAEYWLFQLISLLPPDRWEAHFGMASDKIIPALEENKDMMRYLPAFYQAAVLHKNLTWLRTMIASSLTGSRVDDHLHNYLSLFPAEEREKYTISQVIDLHYRFDDVIKILKSHCAFPWSLEFSVSFARKLSRETYYVHREWFQSVTIYMHKDLIYTLESLQPEDEYRKVLWREVSRQLCEAIVLREEIKQVFSIH